MLLLACTGLLGLYGLDLFRMKKRPLRESSMPRRLIIPNGWETIYYYPHKEVLWVIRRQLPWSISRSKFILPEDLNVAPKPLCLTSDCQTELEEKPCHLHGFKWKCIRCGFTKRRQESFRVEADRALNLMRAELRRQQGMNS